MIDSGGLAVCLLNAKFGNVLCLVVKAARCSSGQSGPHIEEVVQALRKTVPAAAVRQCIAHAARDITAVFASHDDQQVNKVKDSYPGYRNGLLYFNLSRGFMMYPGWRRMYLCQRL